MSGYPSTGHWGAPGPGYLPPEPPRRSTLPIILGIVAVTVVILLLSAGGYVLLRNRDASADGRLADGASPPPTATAGPASPPTASPTPGQTDDATAGATVSPAGAPYSYRVPEGFLQTPPPTSSSKTVGQAAKYTTTVATRRTEIDDLIAVDAFTLTRDSDAISDEDLATEFDKGVKQLGQDPSSRQSGRVNGYRALWYSFDFGAAKSLSYFVFRGTTEVQVRCQWAEQETDIKAGCQNLLDTLTLT